ncbi:hypothetical protein Taro_051491 [Colocasia esculenta]|uniref:Uncharacterized protein n=1 Tax=Colocasia esculenta TaxID=4460 RepID=A0A843XHD4_COLES|nr:hypothetical protein [Colocasia esculenta]
MRWRSWCAEAGDPSGSREEEGHEAYKRTRGPLLRGWLACQYDLSRHPWGTHSYRSALTRRVKVLNATRHPVATWVPKAQGLVRRPFFPFFFLLSSPPPPAGLLVSFSIRVDWEPLMVCRKYLLLLPSPVPRVECLWCVGSLEMEHPAGLPFFWCRDRGARRDTRGCDRVTVHRPDAMASWSDGLTRSFHGGCYHGALPRCDGIAMSKGDVTVPVLPRVFPWFRLGCRRMPQGWLALRTFRWGTQKVASLRSVTEGDTFVAVSWWRCQEARIYLKIDCLARLGVVFVVLARLFARCLALEGLSHSEVVSISWDPHPREPVEGVLWATSMLELECRGRLEFFPAQASQSFFSLSHYALVLELRREVRREAAAWPDCSGAYALVRLCLALSGRLEAEARLESRGSGWCVLLAASGGGLVVVVVMTFPHDVSKCYPLP